MLRLLVLSLALAPAALTRPVSQRANGPKTTPTSVRPHPEARAINPLYADPAVSDNVSPHEYTVGRYGNDDYIIPGSRKRAINPVYVHGGKPEEGEHQYIISRYEDADYIVPGSRRTLRSEVIEDVDFALYFPRPAAINPKYLGHSGEALYKRAESGPLYGSGGQPVHTDVHQTTNPDCGFSSFLAAAVYSDPAWITSMVEASGDFSDTSSAQVDLFSYQSYAPGEYTISHSDTDRNSDIDPATGVWWPGAYNHAALASGMNNVDGRLGPIGPWEAIAAITGKPAVAHNTADPDTIFDLAVIAARDKTPMTLQTVTGGAKTLVTNHAYALLGGTGTGAARRIQLYNPWGETVDLPLESVAADTLTVWSVKDNAVFSGAKTGASLVDTTTSQPTSLESAPTGAVSASSRRERLSPTQQGTDRTVLANAVAVTSAPPLPPHEDAKADENGVVWVTEVKIVYVTA